MTLSEQTSVFSSSESFKKSSAKQRKGRNSNKNARLLAAIKPVFERLEERWLLSAGDPDSTLNSTGKLTTSLSSSSDAHALAIVPSTATSNAGDYLVAGESGNRAAIQLFTPSGAAVTAFNSAAAASNASIPFSQINAVTALPDGSFLVAGWMQDTNGYHEFAIGHYLSTGALDTTFGTGTGAYQGFTLIHFGGANNDNANAMVVYSDGTGDQYIVVAGGGGGSMEVARLNLSNGSLDTTFNPTGGTPGTQIVTFSGSAQANAVAVDPTTGNITIAGYSANGSTSALARLTNSGQLDSTFGTSGEVTLSLPGSSAAGLTLLSSGKYLVAATSNNEFALAELNSNGSLDTTDGFGAGGETITQVGGGADLVTGMAVANDGKIVVVGQATVTGTTEDFGVVRYDSNGTLDTSFNASGATPGTEMVQFTGKDLATAVAIQSDRKIVVAGTSTVSGTDQFALARIQGNTAPVAGNSTASLSTISEYLNASANNGTAVSALVSGLNITDANGDTPLGIAITAADETNGIWEYSTNNGSTWTNLPSVSTTSAMLLLGDATGNDRIRFVPNDRFNTTQTNDPGYGPAPTLGVVAWDGVIGTSGSTGNTTVADNTNSFGTTSATLSIQVTGDPVYDVTTNTPYASIQAAITGATSGDTISIDPMAYSEDLTITGKTLTFLVANSGTATVNSITLDSGAIINSAAASGLTSQTINVNSGAIVQNGIDLAGTGAVVTLANGVTFTENVTLNKALTLQAGAGAAAIIDGGSGTALSVTVTGATVSNITLQGSSTGVGTGLNLTAAATLTGITADNLATGVIVNGITQSLSGVTISGDTTGVLLEGSASVSGAGITLSTVDAVGVSVAGGATAAFGGAISVSGTPLAVTGIYSSGTSLNISSSTTINGAGATGASNGVVIADGTLSMAGAAISNFTGTGLVLDVVGVNANTFTSMNVISGCAVGVALPTTSTAVAPDSEDFYNLAISVTTSGGVGVYIDGGTSTITGLGVMVTQGTGVNVAAGTATITGSIALNGDGTIGVNVASGATANVDAATISVAAASNGVTGIASAGTLTVSGTIDGTNATGTSYGINAAAGLVTLDGTIENFSGSAMVGLNVGSGVTLGTFTSASIANCYTGVALPSAAASYNLAGLSIDVSTAGGTGITCAPASGMVTISNATILLDASGAVGIDGFDPPTGSLQVTSVNITATVAAVGATAITSGGALTVNGTSIINGASATGASNGIVLTGTAAITLGGTVGISGWYGAGLTLAVGGNIFSGATITTANNPGSTAVAMPTSGTISQSFTGLTINVSNNASAQGIYIDGGTQTLSSVAATVSAGTGVVVAAGTANLGLGTISLTGNNTTGISAASSTIVDMTGGTINTTGGTSLTGVVGINSAGALTVTGTLDGTNATGAAAGIGIDSTGGTVNLSTATLTGWAGTGLVLANGSSSNAFTSSSITTTAAANSTAISVSGTVTSQSLSGLTINVSNSSTAVGVLVDGTSVTLTNISATVNTGTGISVTTGTANLGLGTITLAGSSTIGINAAANTTVDITGGAINTSGSSLTGVVGINSAGTLTVTGTLDGTHATSAATALGIGINATGGSVTLAGATLTTWAGTGMAMSNSTTTGTFTGTNSITAGIAGSNAVSASGTVTANLTDLGITVSNATALGVLVNGSSVTLTGVAATVNAGIGVSVTGGAATISGSVVLSGASTTGVNVASGANATVTGTSISVTTASTVTGITSAGSLTVAGTTTINGTNAASGSNGITLTGSGTVTLGDSSDALAQVLIEDWSGTGLALAIAGNTFNASALLSITGCGTGVSFPSTGISQSLANLTINVPGSGIGVALPGGTSTVTSANIVLAGDSAVGISATAGTDTINTVNITVNSGNGVKGIVVGGASLTVSGTIDGTNATGTSYGINATSGSVTLDGTIQNFSGSAMVGLNVAAGVTLGTFVSANITNCYTGVALPGSATATFGLSGLTIKVSTANGTGVSVAPASAKVVTVTNAALILSANNAVGISTSGAGTLTLTGANISTATGASGVTGISSSVATLKVGGTIDGTNAVYGGSNLTTSNFGINATAGAVQLTTATITNWSGTGGTGLQLAAANSAGSGTNSIGGCSVGVSFAAGLSENLSTVTITVPANGIGVLIQGTSVTGTTVTSPTIKLGGNNAIGISVPSGAATTVSRHYLLSWRRQHHNHQQYLAKPGLLWHRLPSTRRFPFPPMSPARAAQL